MTEPRVVARYIAGRYVCGWSTNGIDFRRTGCAHVMPSSAIAHRQNLAPFVSPLATPRSALTPAVPVAVSGRTGAPHNVSEGGPVAPGAPLGWPDGAPQPRVSPLPGVRPTSAPRPSVGAELLGLTPGRRETASAPARTP